MAIPDYADERSHKFFSRGFVGGSHGDNGTTYMMSWSSTSEGLKPTATHGLRGIDYCAYCGNRGFAVQKRRGFTTEDYDREEYRVLGYACPCTGAMDELEYQARRKELEDRHEGEIQDLEATAPKRSQQVLLDLSERAFKNMRSSIERGFAHSEFKSLGIKIYGGLNDD